MPGIIVGLFLCPKNILDKLKHFVYICIDSLIKQFSHELPQDLRQLVNQDKRTYEQEELFLALDVIGSV